MLTSITTRSRSIVASALSCGALAGCGGDAPQPSEPLAAITAPASADRANSKGISDEQARRLVRRHLLAVNDADIDAWTRPLAAQVRFDIAGAIYEGIAEVRDWALRDPIGQRGRYEIHSLRPTRSGLTADVTFRAGTLVELIRYRYTIRRGRIVDKVGRYRQ